MLPPDVIEKVLYVISLLERGFVPGDDLMTPAKACERAGITYAQFRRAIKANAELAELYKEACALAQDVLAEALISISEFYPDAKMAAVVSKNIQWLLARLRREDYGDHVTIEHTSTRDSVLLERMRKARERIGAGGGPPMIEGEIVHDADYLEMLGLQSYP